jgi:2-methylaconitate cis-trans-isomerase PrpF
MLLDIPCTLMRGGTSKGLVFFEEDLPSDVPSRDRILLAAMGSPDHRQIDGGGGGDSLTSKVAIVGRAEPGMGADITYLFAQVAIDRAVVDTTPNCGNMLAAVAPFAIEHGLVAARDGETMVMVYNINTKTVAEVIVQTPGGRVTYKGNLQIAGVPGTAAPIKIDFRNGAGSKTGKLLPTGAVRDVIDGVPVSCVDMTTPMLLIPAAAVGKTGHESKAELDADKDLLARLEFLRQEASRRMGMGEALGKVVPKLALISSPLQGWGVTSRYFTPSKCHAAHAVTGAVCIAVAAGLDGSIVHELAVHPNGRPRFIRVEHPSGFLDVELTITGSGLFTRVLHASVLRTARRLFNGHVLVSDAVLADLEAMVA